MNAIEADWIVNQIDQVIDGALSSEDDSDAITWLREIQTKIKHSVEAVLLE